MIVDQSHRRSGSEAMGKGLFIAGLAALAGAVIVLYFGADSTPTTPSSRRLFGLWRLRHVLSALGLIVMAVCFWRAMQSREKAISFGLSTFMVVALMGLLEGLGAIGVLSWPKLFAPRADGPNSIATKRLPHVDVSGMTRQDLASGWGMPNDPIPFRYKTDRHGFRNDIDRATADVILLGDSIVLGGLVDSRRTVSAVLETRAKRPVMQAALIGISPQAEHEMLWDAGLEVKNRRVIQFIFEGNDLLDSRSDKERKAKIENVQSGSLVDQIWIMLTRLTDHQKDVAGLNVCTIDDKYYAFAWLRNSFAEVEDEMKNITLALEKFRLEVEKKSGRFAIVYVPSKFRVLADRCTFPTNSKLANIAQHLSPFRDVMQEWSRQSGIAVLDLTEPLKASVTAGHIPWFWGDTHWNEIGHSVAADALNKWKFMQD